MTGASQFFLGALVALSTVAALFFARYWRTSRDRLFGFFAAAFVLMAVNWGALAAFAPTEETRHYFYLIRLVAFLLIAFGIVDKNRR
jgi:hypothetical protein